MIGLLVVAIASALDPAAVRACADPPMPGDVKWAIARTVSIETPKGSGTGVVVSADGVVLTAAHVVEGHRSVTVIFVDGTKHEVSVQRVSGARDLALLRGEATDWPCMPVRSVPAEIGGDLLAIGSPGGKALSHSVSKGIVSGYRDRDGTTLIQTDAAINPGNSGGPLVGDTGELLGIVSFKLVGEGVDGLGFGVASTDIPTALSIRWGTSTDAFTDPIRTPAAGFPSLARVELGPDAHFDVRRTYRVARRPNPKLITQGAVIAALGVATIGTTFGIYAGADTMEKGIWDTLLVANLTGWAALIGGAGEMGAGLVIPPRDGPIVPVDPQEYP